MPIEDDAREDENYGIRSTDGRIVFGFATPEEREKFVKILCHAADKSRAIREEGYKCGHCIAFPCFRHTSKTEKGGLCFQLTRRCRQECDFYSVKGKVLENGHMDYSTANGGTCKRDGREVEYEEDCHIPEIRTRLKDKITEL